eukprot:scaffold287219_cov40-Prasinocladus_malaysianus.AAC.4
MQIRNWLTSFVGAPVAGAQKISPPARLPVLVPGKRRKKTGQLAALSSRASATARNQLHKLSTQLNR